MACPLAQGVAAVEAAVGHHWQTSLVSTRPGCLREKRPTEDAQAEVVAGEAEEYRQHQSREPAAQVVLVAAGDPCRL